MRVKRLTVGRQIKWAQIIILLQAYESINAQAQPTGGGFQYGSDTDLSRSMAMITVILVFIFFIIGFFSIYLRGLAESQAGTFGRATGSDRSKLRGLDQAVIDKFPIIAYSAVKNLKIGKQDLECAVCLSEFEDHETLRLLPKCSHIFHPDCIDAWLASHVTCPVCRARLTCCSPEFWKNKLSDTPQLVTESRNEFGETSESGLGETEMHHVVIHVEEDRRRDSETDGRCRFGGKLTRSHSTGLLLVRPGQNMERYTLKLPNDMRRQIVAATGTMRRSASSDVVFAMIGSFRKGSRTSTGRLDQVWWLDPWVLSTPPPFISRGNHVKTEALTSVEAPLDIWKEVGGPEREL